MDQLSLSVTEQILHDQNNNNYEDSIKPIGTGNTLKRAMTVNKLTDMLDCLKDMKSYAKTIEKDLPMDLSTVHIDSKTEMQTSEFQTDDFLQSAKQRLKNHHNYILLSDLIEQKPKSDESQRQHVTLSNQGKSLLQKQLDYMKRVISAQPSALEAIYLEALLNPDQWQHNHHLLQTSPMDSLTSSERKRLNEILNPS